jgi:hypothetical protein
MRGMKKNGAHMPFPHNLTWHIMQQIATGVETLHYLEMIHKDLKVSNILCPQLTKCGLQAIKLTCSRNFPMELFLPVIGLWLQLGLREHGRCSGHSVFGQHLKW